VLVIIRHPISGWLFGGSSSRGNQQSIDCSLVALKRCPSLEFRPAQWLKAQRSTQGRRASQTTQVVDHIKVFLAGLTMLQPRYQGQEFRSVRVIGVVKTDKLRPEPG